MICPFNSSSNNLQPCVGSCQLNVGGSCALTQIAIQLNNISKKLPNSNKTNE